MDPKPPPSHRDQAKRIAEIFGPARPGIHLYWDDAKRASIPIASAPDVPQRGVTSYSTIGLFEAPNYLKGKEYAARVELLGAAGSSFEGVANGLTTAAFCVINSKWFCGPGEIFPDVFKLNKASKALPHGLFVPPFLWDDKFKTQTIDGKTVAWLQLIPISEREREYAVANGDGALEKLFVKEQIDVFDLERASVI